MTKLLFAATFAAVTLTSFAAVVPANAASTRLPCITHQCEPTDIPDNPTNAEACGESLGFLRRVYPEQLMGVEDGTRIWITEVCSGEDLMRSEGNAAGLRNVIAQNDTIIDALGDKSFNYNDVFAVRMMGDDAVTIYVHRFK